ncbi:MULTISPECIES: ATP-binding protein [unclassified Arthrobacter]|uniref:ATP-binding protein n=1 Tax=unclassified Arthrobacter TaxID=235627 RepID=UPI002883093C|nr:MULTISPECIES: ATP-binding protein [unclassified Arthrobacter]
MLESQLEAKVLRGVSALRRGLEGEDDFIEFKSTWPDADKNKFVRQLAGSLNRAGGETVVLVIGIDDKLGSYTSYTSPDVAQWWPKVQSGFDQTPPELARDVNVVVGEGEIVRALAISSSRAPYVVKTGQDPILREIPIREGARTRSAHRDEILRMLNTTVRIPDMEVLSASLTMIERFPYADPSDQDDPGEIVLEGKLKIYVQTNDERPITLARHLMRAYADFAPGRLTLSSPNWAAGNKDNGASGVTETEDGFRVRFPGVVDVKFYARNVEWPQFKQALDQQIVAFSASFPVSGVDRSVSVKVELSRDDSLIPNPDGSYDPMAHWAFKLNAGK